VYNEPERDRLTEMFERHYGEVLGYLIRRVRNRDQAEDLAEATFEFAWRRLSEAPEEPLTKRWLILIARRQLSNYWRSLQRRQHLVEKLGNMRSPQGSEALDSESEVLVAFARLRARDQEVLRLVAWDALSNAEAAAILGCSTNALTIRLHRARNALESEFRSMSEPLGTRDDVRMHVVTQPPNSRGIDGKSGINGKYDDDESRRRS
jgi:RNA polymerase sigma-70 factor, ECF subfamily